MTVFSMLGAFFIGPLKLIFEFIFEAVYKFIQNPGISIIFLSLAMNFLVLPLYRRADLMQEQARDIEAKLHDGVAHIKKTFSGNERMMMLQTYYRQNDYSPVNSLKGSVSLLLEIPFFMAAYQFLSHLELLKGVSFGPISDLSAPDGLLVIAGTAINVLPVLMTLINFISSAIYLKGFPLKTKLQLYGIAIFFLVFLYSSPAGLVFYWTLNNVFSLLKNIFYKLIKPSGEKKKPAKEKPQKKYKPDSRSFFAAAVFLTIFTGILIPSAYIAASPQEYVDTTYYFSPIWYIVSAACLAAGLFILWIGVFYRLAGQKGKVFFERAMWAYCVVAVVSYMFFGSRFGIISPTLRYEEGMVFPFTDGLINFAIVAAVAAAAVFIAVKFKKVPRAVLPVAAAAVAVMSCINIYTTGRVLKDISIGEQKSAIQFDLSREGKNVVVLFLDRAMGEYMPYLLKEKPELKELFDGFTYYSNVISYGGHTNMGAPALMGGYEYTPVELNKRGGESLKEKHNESLKVMPVMFLKNGFNVTVCDAPYANYQWIPDMSIYDDYPEISTHITKGYFGDTDDKQKNITRNLRNFFCFSLMKSLPISFQLGLYDNGNYLEAAGSNSTVVQTRTSMSVASGESQAFMEPYQAVVNLSRMTNITGSGDNFLFFYTDLPHEPMMLQEPEYVPALQVDNTEYDSANRDRFTVGDKHISVTTTEQMIHYQTNMATLLRIGDWLEYLRASGVYDNTRIIIVSDHGYYLYQSQELQFNRPGTGRIDISNYFPLLMVKDFGSRGFTVSDEFMTNADVPTLASEGVIADPVNPFTGRQINDSEKTAHDQFVMTSKDWSVTSNNGNMFHASGWAVITNNIWDRSDWEFIDDKIVLTEHRIP